MGDDFAAAVCHSVRKLGQSLKGWVESDSDYINEHLAEAMRDVARFSEDSFPSNLAKLQAGICEVKRLAEQHDAACEEQNTVLIHPSLPLLESLRVVIVEEVSLPAGPRTRLETVKDLVEQKTPREQICKIYGWFDGDGRPEFDKVDEELAKPNCNSYDLPGWLPPHDRRRATERTARQAVWCEEIWQAMAKKVARWDRKPKESFEEIVKQGVHLQQVAKMFKMSVEAVLKKCEELDLEPPKPLDSVSSTRGIYDPEPDEHTEAAERVFANRPDVATDSRDDDGGDAPAVDEGLSQEAQIINLHLGGNDNRKIAKHLGVKVDRVKAVLARYEDNPDAFDLGDEG